jgi:hypothetical protein
MQVIISFLVIAGIVSAVLIYVANRFGGDTSTLKSELTAERERSNLAQTALREISAGAEMPIFVASDALQNINNTYSTKEIR